MGNSHQLVSSVSKAIKAPLYFVALRTLHNGTAAAVSSDKIKDGKNTHTWINHVIKNKKLFRNALMHFVSPILSEVFG